MDPRPGDIESDVIDLNTCPLEDIRNMEIEHFLPSLDRFLGQIYRSRDNFASDGPPRRAD